MCCSYILKKKLIFENALELEPFNRSPDILKPNIKVTNTNLKNYNLKIILVPSFTFKIVPVLNSRLYSYLVTVLLIKGFSCLEIYFCIKSCFYEVSRRGFWLIGGHWKKLSFSSIWTSWSGRTSPLGKFKWSLMTPFCQGFKNIVSWETFK